MKDPYVNENEVLINKLNIEDEEELKSAEADIGFLKIINIDDINLDYFNADLIKKIHKHIFEDIFDWAGEFRTIPLVKYELVLPLYSIPYSHPKNIEKDLEQHLGALNSISWQNLDIDEISTKFARELALIWRVHPFRDGNTRTTLSFAYLYSKEHGFPFDIETFTNELNREYDETGEVVKYSIRDKFVLACIDEKDYPEVSHLAAVFKKAIENYTPEEMKTHKK